MKIDDDVPALMNPNSAGEKLKVPAKLLLVCLSFKLSSSHQPSHRPAALPAGSKTQSFTKRNSTK